MLNSKVIEKYKRITQRGLAEELSLDQAASSFAEIILAHLGYQPIHPTGTSMGVEDGIDPKSRFRKEGQHGENN